MTAVPVMVSVVPDALSVGTFRAPSRPSGLTAPMVGLPPVPGGTEIVIVSETAERRDEGVNV